MSTPVFRSTDPIGRRLMITEADTMDGPQLVIRLINAGGVSSHTALPLNEAIALQEALYEWVAEL